MTVVSGVDVTPQLECGCDIETLLHLLAALHLGVPGRGAIHLKENLTFASSLDLVSILCVTMQCGQYQYQKVENIHVIFIKVKSCVSNKTFIQFCHFSCQVL